MHAFVLQLMFISATTYNIKCLFLFFYCTICFALYVLPN
jgi:hypothetical protein